MARNVSRRKATHLVALLLAAVPALASLKISVTVMDTKTGRPVMGLKAEDFIVTEEKLPKRIEAVEYLSGVVDVMLLLDTGLDGGFGFLHDLH